MPHADLFFSRTNVFFCREYLFLSRARHLSVDGFWKSHGIRLQGEVRGLVCEHTHGVHISWTTRTLAGQELLSFPNGTAKPMWAVNRYKPYQLSCCDWYSEGIYRQNCRTKVLSTRMYFHHNHCLCHVYITRNHVLTGSHPAFASIGASPSKWP